MIRRPKRYSKPNNSEKAVKFSKKIIILMFVSMAVFTVTMTVIYLLTGGVPDTLITEFFNFFRLEGGALGIIKVAETVAEHRRKKEQGTKGVSSSSPTADEIEQDY